MIRTQWLGGRGVMGSSLSGGVALCLSQDTLSTDSYRFNTGNPGGKPILT